MRTQMIRTWLWTYENLGEILSLIAIILTIQTSDVLLQKFEHEQESTFRSKDKGLLSSWRFFLVLCIVVVSIFVSFRSINIHNKYTVVPDLKEMTYDDAMRRLADNRLRGQLVLAETNENLADPNSRVVWQSIEKNTVVTVEETLSFLIDDGFSMAYMPLNQYKYGEISVKQTKKLDYTIIDDKNVLKQIAEQNAKNKEADTFVKHHLEDPHWIIKVEYGDLSYEMYTSYFDDMPYVTGDTIYSYYVYARSMSLTLDELVEHSVSAIGGKHGVNDYTVLGKLIPVSETGVLGMRSIDVPNHHGVFLLPQSLPCGTYQFYFSLIDSQHRMYDWYHYLIIENNKQD